MKHQTLATAVFCVLALSACESTGERTLGIDATGVVAGVVGVDRGGDGQLGATDSPLRDLEVVLRSRSGRGIVARTLSLANGVFVFTAVPVGDYEVTVLPATIPDSLVLLRVDSANVRVGANDTTYTTVILSYPTISIEDARSAPIGRTLFIEGVVLNARATFGDETLHLAGPERGIRLTRVAPTNVQAWDSVRVLGIRGTLEGQPVLHSAQVLMLRTVEPRTPRTVSTHTAATADNGRLDALLVRIPPTAITDTASLPTGDYRITVNDGSGPLHVVLARTQQFRLNVIGDVFEHTLEATGLLVPNADGSWALKPRSPVEAIARRPGVPVSAGGGR